MSQERIVVDDLVILGEAVPDEISDGRKTVCTAGFSPKHGLIRIYPVPPNARLQRWQVIEIPLERNSRDTRTESWKIQGSKSEWESLPRKIITHEKLERSQWVNLIDRLHKEFGVGCIEDLNEQQLSLGMIMPKEFKPRFEERKTHDPSVQMTLIHQEPFKTVHNYEVQPRMTYRCSECRSQKPHDQQILEWGVYEWLRKNPEQRDGVWKNLHIGESGYHTSFLVGNMFLHRSAFMIISIFRYKM